MSSASFVDWDTVTDFIPHWEAIWGSRSLKVSVKPIQWNGLRAWSYACEWNRYQRRVMKLKYGDRGVVFDWVFYVTCFGGFQRQTWWKGCWAMLLVVRIVVKVCIQSHLWCAEEKLEVSHCFPCIFSFLRCCLPLRVNYWEVEQLVWLLLEFLCYSSFRTRREREMSCNGLRESFHL